MGGCNPFCHICPTSDPPSVFYPRSLPSSIISLLLGLLGFFRHRPFGRFRHERPNQSTQKPPTSPRLNHMSVNLPTFDNSTSPGGSPGHRSDATNHHSPPPLRGNVGRHLRRCSGGVSGVMLRRSGGGIQGSPRPWQSSKMAKSIQRLCQDWKGYGREREREFAPSTE